MLIPSGSINRKIHSWPTESNHIARQQLPAAFLPHLIAFVWRIINLVCYSKFLFPTFHH